MNPEYPISPEASKVNGFTDEYVKQFPTFKEVWPGIKKYFEDSIWIGHNVFSTKDRYIQSLEDTR